MKNKMSNAIATLIKNVADLKARLKDVNADLKAALEDTVVFRDVLKATMEDTRYNVTEKMARTHALKVALTHFTPETDKEDS